jgi:hypothetical protein
MSELTDGLDRIYSSHETYRPHRIRSLGQSLSLEVIEESIQDLPLKLPPEVYELYQWHDGSLDQKFLFENYDFLSLKTAVYKYREELQQVQEDLPEVADFFKYRFPLFENWAENGVFLTVAPNEKGESPIYGYDITYEDYSLQYHRLTDLILHSAEWYEAATFDRLDGVWRVDDFELECRLDVKYMARERIIEIAKWSGGGLRQSVYERYLDESAESS